MLVLRQHGASLKLSFNTSTHSLTHIPNTKSQVTDIAIKHNPTPNTNTDRAGSKGHDISYTNDHKKVETVTRPHRHIER